MPSWASLVRNGSACVEEDTTTTNDRNYDPSSWSSVEQPIINKTQVASTTITRYWNNQTTIQEKNLVLFLLQQHKSDTRLWHIVHPELKLDHDVVHAALEGENISSIDNDLPPEIKNDVYFWRGMIRKNSKWWDQLPSELANNILLVQSLYSFRSQNQISIILHRFPTLHADPTFWLAVIASDYADANFLADMAAPEILQNRTVMLAAVTKKYCVFDLLSDPFNRDREMVQAALHGSIAALLYIPAFVQRLYPDLIADAIRQSTKNEVWEWSDYIGSGVWSNRQVALAWASIGGDYLRNQFPVTFRSDQELFLLIAEHNWSEFCLCSESLRSNKAFMAKAIEKNGILLWEAFGDLHNDYDLALIAFAHSSSLLESFDELDCEDSKFLHGFRVFLDGRLQEHTNFVHQVLVGMKKSDGALAMLNQGAETAMIYQQLISEFIGVPPVTELQKLRAAKHHLSSWRVSAQRRTTRR